MRTNEEQLDLFADLLEPAAVILSDKEIAAMLKDRSMKPIRTVRAVIKRHKAAVLEILARLEGVEPEAYKVPGPIALSMKLLALINQNETELTELFTLQGQTSDAALSGSATENTEDGAD